jgi:hypothetical protein
MNKITLLQIALLCSLFSFAQNIDTTKYQKVTPGDTVRNYYNQNNNNSNNNQNNQQQDPNQQPPKQYQPNKSYPYRNGGRGNPYNNNTAQQKKQPSSMPPFMDKVYYGANLALQYYGGPAYGDVFYYELSPFAGYKFTDKASAGIQIIYNNSILSGGGYPTISYNIFGAGAFGRYIFYRGFFAQVEYDILSVPQDYLGNAVVKRSLSDEKLAGLGFKRNFSDKWSYYFAFLYDFNPEPNSPYYGNNLIYRLGFAYNW